VKPYFALSHGQYVVSLAWPISSVRVFRSSILPTSGCAISPTGFALEVGRDGDQRKILLYGVDGGDVVAHHEIGFFREQQLVDVDLRAAMPIFTSRPYFS